MPRPYASLRPESWVAIPSGFLVPFPSPTADLLLYGGRVLTLDPAQPEAEAVAVSAGHILAVGKEYELRALIAPSTLLLSCSGGTILPGFIDPHLHLFAWA